MKSKNIEGVPYYGLQQKLEYKARIAGCAVIYVDPKYTSQRCPACGKVDKKAMNIRHRGLEKMKQG